MISIRICRLPAPWDIKVAYADLKDVAKWKSDRLDTICRREGWELDRESPDPHYPRSTTTLSVEGRRRSDQKWLLINTEQDILQCDPALPFIAAVNCGCSRPVGHLPGQCWMKE